MRYYGDPILRKQAAKIKEVTPEIRQLAQDMIETMDAYKGIGLAANQIGKLLRIFVIRIEEMKEDGEFVPGEAKVYINPRLSHPAKETNSFLEGCLSFPGIHIEVNRPNRILVEAMNLEGRVFSEELDGFNARVVMHENDHINGTLYIDRCSKEERKRIEPKLRELKKRVVID